MLQTYTSWSNISFCKPNLSVSPIIYNIEESREDYFKQWLSSLRVQVSVQWPGLGFTIFKNSLVIEKLLAANDVSYWSLYELLFT